MARGRAGYADGKGGDTCVCMCRGVELVRIDSPSFNLVQLGPKEAAEKGDWVTAVEREESAAN